MSRRKYAAKNQLGFNSLHPKQYCILYIKKFILSIVRRQILSDSYPKMTAAPVSVSDHGV